MTTPKRRSTDNDKSWLERYGALALAAAVALGPVILIFATMQSRLTALEVRLEAQEKVSAAQEPRLNSRLDRIENKLDKLLTDRTPVKGSEA